MNNTVESVTAAIAEISDDVRSSFGGLSREQLNWKPAADSWSVAQCLDHLIRTSDEFYPEFAKIASGKRKNTFWQSYSPFSGIGGRFLINAVKTDSKKAKAPSKSVVPPSEIEADIVERFIAKNVDVAEKVRSIGDSDWKKTIVTSPFLSVMTYCVDDALTVLIEHGKRHVRQAKRVMESDGFPQGLSLEQSSI